VVGLCGVSPGGRQSAWVGVLALCHHGQVARIELLQRLLGGLGVLRRFDDGRRADHMLGGPDLFISCNAIRTAR